MADDCHQGDKRLANLSASIHRYLSLDPPASYPPEMTIAPGAPSSAAQAMAFFAWYPYHTDSISAHIQPHSPFRTTEIVQCRICERRVGLWSFRMPTRTFNLVDEHLAWCPIRDGKWWEDLAVVDPSRDGTIWDGAGGVKGVLKVSARLERKSWRRD